MTQDYARDAQEIGGTDIISKAEDLFETPLSRHGGREFELAN